MKREKKEIICLRAPVPLASYQQNTSRKSTHQVEAIWRIMSARRRNGGASWHQHHARINAQA